MDISNVFADINKIVERESKTSTYKFALLRGVIDIIQENSPFIQLEDEKAIIPMGLLIEKWLYYYYPLFAHSVAVRQIKSSPQLAFEVQLRGLVEAYHGRGGFSAFTHDLRVKGIPKELQANVHALLVKLRETIFKMPMKHLGQSLGGAHYSIFVPVGKARSRRRDRVDRLVLIEDFGTFSIPLSYYDGFRLFGSFINGRDSIVMKWAELSKSFSGESVDTTDILKYLLQEPVDERAVSTSSKLFMRQLEQQGQLICVWSGKPLKRYVIDHIIPFAAWRNNDLWNLLPTSRELNGQKSDKIPSPSQIDRSSSAILDHWQAIEAGHPQQFRKELQVALLGYGDVAAWKSVAIARLKSTCEYLIQQRGYAAWNHGTES